MLKYTAAKWHNDRNWGDNERVFTKILEKRAYICPRKQEGWRGEWREMSCRVAWKDL